MGSLCSIPSLHKRLGGEKGVAILVRVLYGKVMADDRLKWMFEKTDWSSLMNHLSYFLTFAFGGPCSYAGKTLLEAHALVNEGQYPDEIQFDAFLENLNATLKDLFVDPEDIDEILRIVLKIKSNVLGVVQDIEDSKKEKQDDLNVAPLVKSKNGRGNSYSSVRSNTINLGTDPISTSYNPIREKQIRRAEWSLSFCSPTFWSIDPKVRDNPWMVKMRDSGCSLSLDLESQSSCRSSYSRSSYSRKYLHMDELFDCGYQSFDGITNFNPAVKHMGKAAWGTASTEELNPGFQSFPDTKDRIGKEDEVLELERNLFREANL